MLHEIITIYAITDGSEVGISGNQIVVGTKRFANTAYIFRRADSP